MTSEEYVRSIYPTASIRWFRKPEISGDDFAIVKYVNNGDDYFLADGSTELEAWENTEKHIQQMFLAKLAI